MITSLLYGKRNRAHDRFLQNRAPIRSIPDSLKDNLKLRMLGDHVFLEAGKGRPIIFCHGLFGGIYNAEKIAEPISGNYRFLMPFLPMYDLPLAKCRVKTLGTYLRNFMNVLQLEEAVLVGNSMGGGAAAYLAAENDPRIKGLVLCGSSGLSNIPLSNGYFKRKNYSFVKSSTQDIFYNRDIPPDQMVSDVFNAIQDTELVIRSIRFTKSAISDKMNTELSAIRTKTLLIWGKQDPVTPVTVAPLFKEKISDSSLHIIDECGHVPTQEKPVEFMHHFNGFLQSINY